MIPYDKRRTRFRDSSGFQQNVGKAGVVYILLNRAFITGLYKIGCSTRSGAARAADLNNDANTGTPALFTCTFEISTADCGLAEQRVFLELSKNRTGKRGQEYFQVNIDHAKEVIRLACIQVDRENIVGTILDSKEVTHRTHSTSLTFAMPAQLPASTPPSASMPVPSSTNNITSAPASKISPVYASTRNEIQNKITEKASSSLDKTALFIGLLWIIFVGIFYFGSVANKSSAEVRRDAAALDSSRFQSDSLASTQSDSLENLGPSDFEKKDEPLETAVVPQATFSFVGLKNALTPQVEYFDEKTGTGLITYSFLPEAAIFDSHRKYLGQPYEIKLIQTIEIKDELKKIFFFSSKPISIDTDFECRLCKPILSAMLFDESVPPGLGVVLPLQPIELNGAWGAIRLDEDRLPYMIRNCLAQATAN